MGKKTDKPMTEAEFSQKVAWEGGVFGALEYGLKADDCEPGPLRDAWYNLELSYERIAPDVDTVNELLISE